MYSRSGKRGVNHQSSTKSAEVLKLLTGICVLFSVIHYVCGCRMRVAYVDVGTGSAKAPRSTRPGSPSTVQSGGSKRGVKHKTICIM